MGDGLVQARDLRKSFGTFEAVRGIDVDVAPGEVFGFLGPNGAGKSTTMRMIACVSPRSGGTLQVLGMDPDVDGPRAVIVPVDGDDLRSSPTGRTRRSSRSRAA